MPTGVGWRVLKSVLLELLLSIARESKEQSIPGRSNGMFMDRVARLGLGLGLRVGFSHNVLGILKTVFL